MRVGVALGGLVIAVGVLVGLRAFSHHGEGNLVTSVRVGPARDISENRGPQSEVAIAADPRRPHVLVAGSNDIAGKTMRVYSTSDGGKHWLSGRLPPPRDHELCEASDPTIEVADDGAAYYAFLGIRCERGRIRSSSIYVATRRRASGAWHTLPLPVSVGRRTTLADDRPSISVDDGAGSHHLGRLYLAWSRFSFDVSSLWADPDQQSVNFVSVSGLISHSDDAGRHWSRPTVLTQEGEPLELRTAVARSGDVYAVWRDASSNSIWLAHSTDGMTFPSRRFVAASVVLPGHSCHTARARIPAQPQRCVSPNPVVAVDDSGGPHDGTVYVVWGTTALNRSQDVDVAAFAPDLKPLLGVGRVQEVNPPEGIPGRDQFLPTAAVDASGRLWACYYETKLRERQRARFACTSSADGGHTWTRPQATTAVFSDESRKPANVANGYGDYEGVTAAGDGVVAAWTDGSALRTKGEEIWAARVSAHTAERTK